MSRGKILIEGQKISLVIFDMDGLMFDTERISIPAWQKAGRDFNYEIGEETVVKTIGFDHKGTEKIFKEIYGGDFPYDEIKQRKVTNVLAYIRLHGIPVKEGLYALLDFLKSKSVLLGIATSSSRERVIDYLSAAKLMNAFDITVSGNEISRGKPAPDIFIAAAKGLDVPKQECLVIEDSENGIKAAAAAGMIPILVPDILRISPEVEKLVVKKFNSLHEVREYLETQL
jgi:HAD superfamily hydrolase (TIGR01509 family)